MEYLDYNNEDHPYIPKKDPRSLNVAQRIEELKDRDRTHSTDDPQGIDAEITRAICEINKKLENVTAIDPEDVSNAVSAYLSEHPVSAYDDTEVKSRISTLESVDVGTKVQNYVATHQSELKGADGVTPVKGTDYFTQADITSIKTDLQTYIDSKVTELIGGALNDSY